MKKKLLLSLAALALPLAAQDAAPAEAPAPAAETAAAEPAPAETPAEPAYDSDDLQLEGALHELKEQAEGGDAAAMRQLYMRYAVKGYMEQAKAWADRSTAALEKLGAEGDVVAMLTLGTNYMTGKDLVTPDTAKAVTWLLRAADAGEPAAAYILGDIYAQQKDEEMSRAAYARAYDAYRKLDAKAAEAGEPKNANVLYWLGYMQQNGIGTAADGAAGIALLEQAAELGNPWAYQQLFKTFAQGIATDIDMARAIGYARKIADGGQDGLMAYATALAYLKGDGVEKDEATGEKYLDMAAKLNIPDAIFLKGQRLQQAGQAEDALRAYAQAASMGQEHALIEAALMLLYGQGVEKDEARGLAYLETADARLGSPRAPYELARYYESIGEQGLADDWYIAASDAGIIEAMGRRGWLHVLPFSKLDWSPTAAYQWWRTGKENGDPDCTLYQRLFIYAFCPLVLAIVFGLPLLTVRYLSRKADKEEAKG